MHTKKLDLVVILIVVAIICLAVASFITLGLAENARIENAGAQAEILELKDSISSLELNLNETRNKISEQGARIEKYQEIINAWSKATPNVNEAVSRIVNAGEEVLRSLHLYPASKVIAFEDEMMDAIYGAVRSTDPLSYANDFEDRTASIYGLRYDVIFTEKIEKIKENGVTFPEDAQAIKEARAYYDGFFENAAVVESFVERGLYNALLRLEALLDKDEENDLAKAFENEVAAINTPITSITSFERANDAWEALCNALESDDVLKESTVRARAMLDLYVLQVNRLDDLINSIRKEIDRIHSVDPDVTHDDIAALDEMVDELASLGATVEMLNTRERDYVALLNDARLLPHKNEAFAEIKAVYDTCYAQANGDRDTLISLVKIKDAVFNAIENATSIESIDSMVESATSALLSCLE